MTDRTSTPPAPGLREAAAKVIAEYDARSLWHKVDYEPLTEAMYALDGALRAESVAAPLDDDPTWAHTAANDPAGLYDDHWEPRHAPPALDAARLEAAFAKVMDYPPADYVFALAIKEYERAATPASGEPAAPREKS